MTFTDHGQRTTFDKEGGSNIKTEEGAWLAGMLNEPEVGQAKLDVFTKKGRLI